MIQGGNASGGFTIVETMIVLAVSAILAVSALILVNGRQNKTEFQVAINDLQQQLQQIVNESESGFYPNSGNFTCQATPGTQPVITAVTSSGQNTAGTNTSCIFLGKVIYFGPGNADNSYTVYPVAGNRLGTDGNSVTSLAAAWPVAISLGATTNQNAPDNNYTTYQMENGLSYVWNLTGGNGNDEPMALGFMSSLNPGADTGASGSQQFRLWGFSNDWSNMSGSSTGPTNVVDDINNATTSATPPNSMVEETGSVEFCIASGTTQQSGLFTISDGLTVDLQIMNGTTCGQS